MLLRYDHKNKYWLYIYCVKNGCFDPNQSVLGACNLQAAFCDRIQRSRTSYKQMVHIALLLKLLKCFYGGVEMWVLGECTGLVKTNPPRKFWSSTYCLCQSWEICVALCSNDTRDISSHMKHAACLDATATFVCYIYVWKFFFPYGILYTQPGSNWRPSAC